MCVRKIGLYNYLLFQPVLWEWRSVKLARNVRRTFLMTCLAVDLTRSTVLTQRGVSGMWPTVLYAVSTIIYHSTSPHYFPTQGCPLGEKYCESVEECVSTHTPDTECCHNNGTYCSEHGRCMASTLSDEECGKVSVILPSVNYSLIWRMPGRWEVLCRGGTVFTTKHWGQCVLWTR